MASYNSIVLTTAGTQMLNSAISNGTKITFTKAQTSQTQYSQSQLTNLTVLSPTAQETVDLNHSNASSTKTKISITFTNKTVTTAYNANTVALFASNGTDEFLFAVATAKNAENVPAFDGTQAQSMVIDFYLALNAENAIIEVTNSGMATSQELTDAQSQLNNQISTVDKNAVHLAGNETIIGAKTFTQKINGSITQSDTASSTSTLALDSGTDLLSIGNTFNTTYTLDGTYGNTPDGFSGKGVLTSLVNGNNWFITLTLTDVLTAQTWKRAYDGKSWTDWKQVSVDKNAVHISGNETIVGDKSFSGTTEIENVQINNFNNAGQTISGILTANRSQWHDYARQDSSENIRWAKFGNIVTLSGQLANWQDIQAGTELELCTLPDELVPKSRCASFQISSNVNNLGQASWGLQIYENHLAMTGFNVGGKAQTAPKGTWFPFAMSYVIN